MLLKVYEIIDYGDQLNSIILILGFIIEGTGIIMQLYQQKQKDHNYLMKYALGVSIGIAILFIITAFNIIHIPSFLKNIF